MNFQKLELKDIPLVKEYYEKHTNRTCDRTIGGTFMWRDYFKTQYTVYKNTLVMKCRFEDENMFCFPVGEHPEEALKEMEKYCLEHKEAMNFVSVVKDEADYLKARYPQAVIRQEDDWSDYLYLCSDHASFPGKKFHTQKNHVNKFAKTYENWSFEKITKENLPAVKDFYARYEKDDLKDSDTAVEERIKTGEVLDHFEEYAMDGYVLSVNGEVAGFAVCEVMGQVLSIHIEKVNKEIVGANATIVQQVAKQYEDRVMYTNREDDAGDEGLRYSKIQYRPIELLGKYEVEVPIHEECIRKHEGPIRKCTCAVAGCK